MFDARNTDGLLDIIFVCTLIFILLSALVQVETGKGQELNEIALPEIALSKTQGNQAGSQGLQRVRLSIKGNLKANQVWIDDEESSLKTLKEDLHKKGAITSIALRREKDVTCGLEDQVIMICQRAGIQNLSIVVRKE